MSRQVDEISHDLFFQRALSRPTSPSMPSSTCSSEPSLQIKFSTVDHIITLNLLRIFLAGNSNPDWNLFYNWWKQVYCKSYIKIFTSPIIDESAVHVNEQNLSLAELKHIVNGTIPSADEFPTLEEINSTIISLRNRRLSSLNQSLRNISEHELNNAIAVLKRHVTDVEEDRPFPFNFKPDDLSTQQSLVSPAMEMSTMQDKQSCRLLDPYIDVDGEDKNNLTLYSRNIKYSDDIKDEETMTTLETESIIVHPLTIESPTFPVSRVFSSPDDMSEIDLSPYCKEWRKKMLAIIREISHHKRGYFFIKMVQNSDAPGYSDIVKKPTCLSLIKSGIKDKSIYTTQDVHKSLLLMILNALTYNLSDSIVHQAAKEILSLIDRIFSKVYHEEDINIKNKADIKIENEIAMKHLRNTNSSVLEKNHVVASPGYELARKPETSNLIGLVEHQEYPFNDLKERIFTTNSIKDESSIKNDVKDEVAIKNENFTDIGPSSILATRANIAPKIIKPGTRRSFRLASGSVKPEIENLNKVSVKSAKKKIHAFDSSDFYKAPLDVIPKSGSSSKKARSSTAKRQNVKAETKIKVEEKLLNEKSRAIKQGVKKSNFS